MQRRLAAVMVADVVGYSRLMGIDEAGTLAALRDRRRGIVEPAVKAHSGRIVKLMGDGVLVEFASAVNAVACALAVQEGMAAANGGVPEDRRILLRIGINVGEVVGEGSDIYGEGVNVAARLEALAEPGGICVSAKLHDEVRGKVAAGFDDLGAQRLKNIARPVPAFRVRAAGRAGAQPADRPPPLTRPAGHAIAVLPFDNMSGEPGQQYLSDGITEDVITELSRFRNLAVAARHASAHFGSKGATIAEVARALAVDFVVEGSVRRSGDRLRIAVQLIDAETGNHLWAERYDRQAGDIFAVLDEVVAAVAANVEGRVAVASAALARRRPSESWTAYDCVLQGRELCNFHREPESIPFFARAVAIDPGFAHAHAWLGLALAVSFMFEFDPRLLDRAVEAGQRALALDANEPAGHWACAMGLTWKGQLDAAGRHFDRAIALNPADLQIRADRANWLRYCGRAGEALAAIDDALRQGPLAPGWFHGVRGRALFDLRRYADAIAAFDSMPEKSVWAWVYLVAAHGLGGDAGGAAEAIAAVRRERPALSPREIAMGEPYAKREALEHLLEGLRKAGPET